MYRFLYDHAESRDSLESARTRRLKPAAQALCRFVRVHLVFRCIASIGVMVMIPGCGVVCDVFGLLCTGGASETGSSELKRFGSEKELADYFAQQINAGNDRFAAIDVLAAADRAEDGGTGEGVNTGTDAPAAPDADGGTAEVPADDFSQTTIQEEGVDEADIVKTDGHYVYVIHNNADGAILRIVNMVPAAELAEMIAVPLQGYGREMYLHDGKVVALTETFGRFYAFGGPGVAVDPVPVADDTVDSGGTTDPDAAGTDTGGASSETDFIEDVTYERPRTIVSVVDVSNPEEVAVLSATEFDGVLSSSRMIDGVLHLVVSNYQDYYYDVLPLLGQSGLDVSEVDTSEFLPKVRRVDAEGGDSTDNLVTWQTLYRPTDPDGFGVVTVVSLDVDNDAAFSAVGIVAQPGLIYSSLNALYLTDTQYDFFGQTRETTDVYKFGYVGRGAEAVATGTVSGRVLNQYSMSEYQGHLRVATTEGPFFSVFGERSGPLNNVYVLGQSGTSLEVVGSEENIEPGETIQSARFVGDRGYLVTFRQIDPLLTLDLSEPTDPRVVGKLEVPGYSTFIVPMDEDHLLTVGQYIPDGGLFFGWGVQLSIFDVSDFARPVRTANVVLGESGSASSEALYNPKALTYFTERGLVALPVSIYDEGGVVGPVPVDASSGGTGSDGQMVDTVEADVPPPDDGVDLIEPWIPQGFEGVVVYEVGAKQGITELGRISTRFEEAGLFWSSFARGVFIGDNVFAVTDHGVSGSPLSDVESVPYQLLFSN